MIVPNNWNEIESKEMGDFSNLTVGGHTCIIMDVREYTSELTGNTSLRVCVDISENNEFKDYFKKQYEANKDQNKKWPSGATKYLSLKDEQMTYLKGFITAVEKSNNKKILVESGKELNLEQFKGLKIAGVFGLEEYENDKKEVKTIAKLTQFRSLDKLSEIKIPRVKLLDETYIDYEEYMKKSNTTTKKELSNKEIDKLIEDAGITL